MNSIETLVWHIISKDILHMYLNKFCRFIYLFIRKCTSSCRGTVKDHRNLRHVSDILLRALR